ncbi:MAG: polymer-forming cytoskeletal protein [Minisyncoccales bacterium]
MKSFKKDNGNFFCMGDGTIEEGCIVRGNVILGRLKNSDIVPYSATLDVYGEVTGFVKKNGDVSCVNSRVIVRDSGIVWGINGVHFADVSGSVNGNVEVSEYLIVRKGCRISGKASAFYVYFEEGVDPSQMKIKAAKILKEEPKFSFL